MEQSHNPNSPDSPGSSGPLGLPDNTGNLDETVARVGASLESMGVRKPDVLFFLGTGASTLGEGLQDGHEIELGDVDGIPAAWEGGLLYSGRLGDLEVWALDDTGGDPSGNVGRSGWTPAFPVWLAANAGAQVLVHTSAGTALANSADISDGRQIGSLALLNDHINLCGNSPLVGLGPSRLGPLFPDQSRSYHVGLRRATATIAERLSLPTFEAVAACTSGPALETPAERRMFARAGADVIVQSLAPPLIASAHAGLAMLALVVVSEVAEAESSTIGTSGVSAVADLVQRATEMAPQLERLMIELVPELERAVKVLRAEADA